MNKIIDLFNQNKYVNDLYKSIKHNKSILVSGAYFSHDILTCVSLFNNENKSIIYVASNIYKSTMFYETLCEMIGLENVHLYVIDEVISTEAMATSHEFLFERLHTIQSILENKKKVIVTNISAITRFLIPKEEIEKNKITFARGEIINRNDIIKKFVEIGYNKTPTTSQVGEVSIRGEVIDIFPINSLHPVRIDLFDDEIDNIKLFDENTQKTTEALDYINIYPVNELIYQNPEEIVEAIKNDSINPDLLNQDLEDILSFKGDERLQKYLKYIYPKQETLIDYIDDAILLYEDPSRLKESYDKSIIELNAFLENQKAYNNLNLCFFDDYFTVYPKKNTKIYFIDIKHSLNDLSLDDIIDFHGLQIINYQNNLKHFITDVYSIKKTFVIAFSKEESMHLLESILQENQKQFNIANSINDILKDNINLIVMDNPLSFGFSNDIEVISEYDIFKKLQFKKAKYRSVYQNTAKLLTKEDLKPGDFIVHYDYGIGQYLGIKTVELSNIKNDYLRILFADIELFIPVEKINMIEKYLGSESSIPKLTTVGSKEWENKKKKIKAKLQNIAKNLIDLQAIREQSTGFVYQKDDEIQKQFEEDFAYVETPDQLKAINEIKKDMENGKIVDRLVCGDVGYGKTEVAIRIAMKAVLNGQQVAYLAPTTILTRQHYHTFLDRFDKYGIRVELLNRLVSEKKQSLILQDLKDGKVDIIIGTHSLLNDEVKYKNLGLLIVDEEQRFGVLHKEKIKQYKNTINVLTLTATPIPRTLQMSIMGIRQLSLIETPPQNRYPVQTYVLEENDAVIREAIYRELGRGGQIFYLHNRISDIDRVAIRLHRLVPEAKIVVAHGKMNKEQIEDCMQMFIDREYDLMVCTTIIETGIDIPNTNTLIIDTSDRLGLAQMYQIRGRVGRSDRVSYAYFMFEHGKVLTNDAKKRLQAIREFTTLGSGYKIAVRDLAIRGAGDILGSEQSGFIDSVGLDLYMKLLNESILEAQGKKEVDKKDINYRVEVSKHVSDKYVSDDDIKIYIHKEIHSIETKERREEVINELEDRFGKLTEEIKTYIDKQYMDGLCKKHFVEKIQETPSIVTLTFKQDSFTNTDNGKLFYAAYEISPDISFEYKNHKIIMKINKHQNNKKWIELIIQVFENMDKKLS